MFPGFDQVVANFAERDDSELDALIGNTKDKPRRSGVVVGAKSATACGA
jgi:hypothetical protein